MIHLIRVLYTHYYDRDLFKICKNQRKYNKPNLWPRQKKIKVKQDAKKHKSNKSGLNNNKPRI